MTMQGGGSLGAARAQGRGTRRRAAGVDRAAERAASSASVRDAVHHPGLPRRAAVRDARVLVRAAITAAGPRFVRRRCQPRGPQSTAFGPSLQIAVLTVVGMLLLLVPTMVWTVVRVPQHAPRRRVPVPAADRHPGDRHRRGHRPDLPVDGPDLEAVGGSPLTLALIDIILVLPFAYRAIDAGLRTIDVATLADAARSLGAGWPRTILQVIVPEHPRAASCRRPSSRSRSSSASSRSRRCSSFNTLQVVIFLLGKRDPFVSVAVSLAALVFAFVLSDRHHPLRAGRRLRTRARQSHRGGAAT